MKPDGSRALPCQPPAIVAGATVSGAWPPGRDQATARATHRAGPGRQIGGPRRLPPVTLCPLARLSFNGRWYHTRLLEPESPGAKGETGHERFAFNNQNSHCWNAGNAGGIDGGADRPTPGKDACQTSPGRLGQQARHQLQPPQSVSGARDATGCGCPLGASVGGTLGGIVPSNDNEAPTRVALETIDGPGKAPAHWGRVPGHAWSIWARPQLPISIRSRL